MRLPMARITDVRNVLDRYDGLLLDMNGTFMFSNCFGSRQAHLPGPPARYSDRSFCSASQLGRPFFHLTAAAATSDTDISDRENGRTTAAPACT